MKLLLAKKGYLFLLAVLILHRSQHSTADEVFFSQCECPGTSFSVVDPDSAVGLSSLTKVGNVFSCPTLVNNFPSSPGVVIVNTGTASSSLTGTILKTFQSSGGTLGNNWFGTMTFSMNSFDESDNSNLIEIRAAEQTSPIFNVNIANDDGGGTYVFIVRGMTNNNVRGTESITTSLTLNTPISLVFGYSNGVGAAANTAVTYFLCLRNGETPTCITTRRANTETVTTTAGSTLTVNLLSVAPPQSLDAVLQHFSLSTSTAVAESDLVSFFNNNVPSGVFPAVGVPKTSLPEFRQDEDILTTYNLDDLIQSGSGSDYSITFPTGTLSFPTGNANTFAGPFQYRPPQDVNTDQPFSFIPKLTTPYACSGPSVSHVVKINPVNDKPVLVVVPSISVFAGVSRTSNASPVIVANDVDFADGRLGSGTLTILTLPTKGTLFTNTACSSLASVGTAFTVATGGITYCYTPSISMSSGVQDEFTYTVSDGLLTADGIGKITFSGSDSVIVASTTPLLRAVEDTTLSFTFASAQLNFGENLVNLANNKDFSVTITELPNPTFGKLQRNSGADVLDTDVFLSTEQIRYIPSANFFNRQNDKAVDEVGNTIVSNCPNQIVGCPGVFKYRLSSNGFETGEGTANLLVSAVDDGNPIIVFPETATVPPDTETLLSGVSFSSDGGTNIFKVTLNITSFDGVEFRYSQTDASTVSPGTTLANHLTFASDVSCTLSLCSTAEVTGLPIYLTELVATLKIKGATGTADPRITFDVTTIATAVGVPNNKKAVTKVVYEQEEPRFFDDQNNIYIVAGAGGGGVLLIVGVLIIFRGGFSSGASEEKLLGVAEKAVEIELRGRENKHIDEEAALKSKKSIKINVDDEIFDWEKHIDKESGEVYFFNPKTGESQWDPPTVKKYDL